MCGDHGGGVEVGVVRGVYVCEQVTQSYKHETAHTYLLKSRQFPQA